MRKAASDGEESTVIKLRDPGRAVGDAPGLNTPGSSQLPLGQASCNFDAILFSDTGRPEYAVRTSVQLLDREAFNLAVRLIAVQVPNGRRREKR